MTLRLAFCCTDTPPAPWLQALRAALPQAEVGLWQSGNAPADYGVVWAPPQAFFDEQPRLKAAFNIGAGVDALLKLRIPADTLLVRLDDAGMAEQMAEYVCHALIAAWRGFADYAVQASRAQWLPQDPPARGDFVVGVMGLGVLGAQVAQAVARLGFSVKGWSRSGRPLGSTISGVACHAGDTQLPAFLDGCHALVCLLPLTPQTADILNRQTLSQLRPGAWLINVARGGHLVEADLLALLDSGHMAGAVLDVFRTEPLPVAHPFWSHPRVHVTPHIAARTLLAPSVRQIAEKILALESARPVAGVVDAHRGY